MKKYFIRKSRLGNAPSLFVYNDSLISLSRATLSC